MKKDGSNDTMIMVGIALLVLAGVMAYLSLSSPHVYVDEQSTSAATQLSRISSASSTTEESVTQNTKLANTVSTSVAEEKIGSQSDVSVQYPINLNTATMEQLKTIDGIGESRAYQIIAYREKLGGYTSVEQIKDIKGIGNAIFDRVAPYLTV